MFQLLRPLFFCEIYDLIFIFYYILHSAFCSRSILRDYILLPQHAAGLHSASLYLCTSVSLYFDIYVRKILIFIKILNSIQILQKNCQTKTKSLKSPRNKNSKTLIIAHKQHHQRTKTVQHADCLPVLPLCVSLQGTPPRFRRSFAARGSERVRGWA